MVLGKVNHNPKHAPRVGATASNKRNFFDCDIDLPAVSDTVLNPSLKSWAMTPIARIVPKAGDT